MAPYLPCTHLLRERLIWARCRLLSNLSVFQHSLIYAHVAHYAISSMTPSQEKWPLASSSLKHFTPQRIVLVMFQQIMNWSDFKDKLHTAVTASSPFGKLLTPVGIKSDILCHFSPKKQTTLHAFFTFYYPKCNIYMRLLVLLYTMLPRVIFWERIEKVALETLEKEVMQHLQKLGLSTHVDKCVPIHQFCDGLNSLQADLQLVSITLNHSLKEAGDNLGQLCNSWPMCKII